MCVMTLIGDYNDPEIQCDGCEVIFNLFWQRDGIHDRINYCPFCGDDVEEIVDDTEDEDYE